LRVSEYRLLKRQREEVTRGWRQLYNEELHSLNSLPNIRVTNSRKVRWVWHVACN